MKILTSLAVMLAAACSPSPRNQSAPRDTAAPVTATVEGIKYMPRGKDWGRIAFQLDTDGPTSPECSFQIQWMDADGFVIKESIARGPVPGIISDDWNITEDEFGTIKSWEVQHLRCSP